MYKNYSPVSRDMNSLAQAWHTNRKTQGRMWGTTLFSWKLFPSECCTALTQRKSNLAVRIARLWESWSQSDVTYSWNVPAAPNHWLSPTNKISSSGWWKTKRVNYRVEFQQEITAQILTAYLELRQTIAVRKKKWEKPKPQHKLQMLSKYALLIISNVQGFSFWQKQSGNTPWDEEQRLAPQHWAPVYKAPAIKLSWEVLGLAGWPSPGHLSPFWDFFLPQGVPHKGSSMLRILANSISKHFFFGWKEKKS